jgi:transposase
LTDARLNRGGDRGASNARYVVVLSCLRYDPRTRAYAERRTREGLSKPEIIRSLKRCFAREIFNALPTLVPENRSTHPLARP